MADVIVIGGGPAACAATLELRAGGVAVTVIAAGRAREKPTETAVSRLGQLLHSLGAGEALATCEPCYGIESNWGPPGTALQPSILNPFGNAWFIHRQRFDACLTHLAKAAGAGWMQAEALHIHVTPDGVGVETTAGPFSSRNILVANGSPALAARMTGQKPTRIDTLVCYWARLPVPLDSRLLHVEAVPDGWWYLCPGEADTTVVCFLTDAEAARRLAPASTGRWNALFQTTRLRDQFACHAQADEIRSLPVRVAGLSRRHGARWVAAGDAAIKLDPIGSSGTATAIESGVRAARALLDGLQGDRSAAENYERWGDGLMAEFLKRRTPLYASEARKHQEGFWTRRN